MAIENVRIPSGTSTIGGLLASPQGRGPFPAVIMIPTIRALDEFAGDVIERLAVENFVALAVNFFDHPGVPEDIFKRPGAQPDEQVLGDLNAALAMLRQHPLVGDQPVFAWGYCLGGRFALLWPTFQHGLAGAASFHGFPTNDTQKSQHADPAGGAGSVFTDARDRLLRRSRSPRAAARRRCLSQCINDAQERFRGAHLPGSRSRLDQRERPGLSPGSGRGLLAPQSPISAPPRHRVGGSRSRRRLEPQANFPESR